MPLFIFQSLIVLFALATLYNVVKLKQKGTIGIRGAIFWTLFWLGVSVVVMWPQGVQIIARTFGVGRGTDFVLYISVITLFFLIFRLHIKIENIARSITKIARREALEKKRD